MNNMAHRCPPTTITTYVGRLRHSILNDLYDDSKLVKIELGLDQVAQPLLLLEGHWFARTRRSGGWRSWRRSSRGSARSRLGRSRRRRRRVDGSSGGSGSGGLLACELRQLSLEDLYRLS